MPIQKVWLGQDCGCLAADRIPRSTHNPFELTLTHVHDEFGKPLYVENLYQLSAAEKRYGFESCVLSRDQQNFDDPPQQKSITMSDLYKRKFSGGAR